MKKTFLVTLITTMMGMNSVYAAPTAKTAAANTSPASKADVKDVKEAAVKVAEGTVIKANNLVESAMGKPKSFGVGITAGTTGLGYEIGFSNSHSWGVRLAKDSFDTERDIKVSDNEYKTSIKSDAIQLLFDYFPSANNGFRFTSGITFNNSSISARKTNSSYVKLNNVNYKFDSFSYKAKVPDNSLYLGIGTGSIAQRPNHVSFLFDLGLIINGSPSISSDCSGIECNKAAKDIAIEQKTVADKLNALKIYPVLRFGLAYRF